MFDALLWVIPFTILGVVLYRTCPFRYF